jgi:THO complex subunit 1
LPEYLENMVTNLAKKLPPPSEEIKTGEDEDKADNAVLEEHGNPYVQTGEVGNTLLLSEQVQPV